MQSTTLYQKPHNLSRTTVRGDIAVLTENMNPKIGRLSSNKAHLGLSGLDS